MIEGESGSGEKGEENGTRMAARKESQHLDVIERIIFS